MTRRTTVLQPSTETDALYTLPSQPFARKIVSVSIYNFVIAGAYHNCMPELKIADVGGNVLTALSPLFDAGSAGGFTDLNFFMGDLGGSNYTYTAPIILPPITLIPTTLPPNLCVPESNILTVTIWGSVPGDTIPNLVLVTEDEDDEFIY
jgi:hypothetical protein